jgi:hypothetical protein
MTQFTDTPRPNRYWVNLQLPLGDHGHLSSSSQAGSGPHNLIDFSRYTQGLEYTSCPLQCPLSWSHVSLFRPTSVLPDESVDSLC